MSASEADILRSSIRAVGIELNTVFDLVNSRRSYRAAIPILIAALEKGIADAGLKEAVVRALGAKEARGTEAGRVLIEEYWRLPTEEAVLRWTIGNTIAIIADESVFQEVARIVVITRTASLGRCSFFRSEELRPKRQESY